MKSRLEEAARHRRAVAIFCRAPREGEVKSRLARARGAQFALDFYRAALCDSFALCAQVKNAQVVACFTPPDAAREEFGDGVQGENALTDVLFLAQTEGDLGQKIGACFADLFGRGFGEVVIVGSDSPDLPLARIERALELLASNDFVFGPAFDGGFYLMGARAPLPDDFFAGVEWSSPQTLQQMEANLARVGNFHWSRLPFWGDVDEIGDLEALEGRLKLGAQSPRVREFLGEMMAKKP